MEKIYTLAKQNDVPVHLDGARLFNAAAYLDVNAKEITKYCDTVMFCLSKGLCAPIGSMLAGDKNFINKARKKRKVLGGGLRQVGILAAAGLVALQEMIPQLKTDHENAILLGEELSKIPGIIVNKEDTHINMVFFNMHGTGFSSDKLVEKFYNRGIKINGEEDGLMRFVTHNWVSKKDIKFVVDSIKEILSSK
jgi:threonine aldolase